MELLVKLQLRAGTPGHNHRKQSTPMITTIRSMNHVVVLFHQNLSN